MSKAEELANKLNILCVAEFAWPYLNDAATELRRLHAANVYTSDLCTQALEDVRRLAAENEALEAKLAQRVPDGWASKELVRLADILRDCGRLVSSSGKAEDILRTAAAMLSAAPAAPEQQEQEQPPEECPTPRTCSYEGACRGDCKPVAKAPNAQQAETLRSAYSLSRQRPPIYSDDEMFHPNDD